MQQFTKLPVSVVVVSNKQMPDVFVATPHKGSVEIELKDESFGLFGGGFQYDVHSRVIIDKLNDLENEAKDFLLERWLKDSAPKE